MPSMEQAAKMYRQGATSKEVAEYLGVSAPTAINRLRSVGVQIRERGPRLLAIPPNIAEAVKMYKAGESSVLISQYLGVSGKTALDMLRAEGVSIRKPGWKGRAAAEAKSKSASLPQVMPKPVLSAEEVHLRDLTARWSQRIPDMVAEAMRDAGLTPRR